MSLPKVNVNVGEETLSVSNNTIPFIPAIILKTKSGPIGTVETITSESQFKAIFGESDYTVPSAYALQLYLRTYSYVLVTRIANTSEAAIGTGTLSFTSNDTSINLISAETNYKTDLFNGKEIKLVYDGTAHKIWLDVSSITGKNTISIKEDYTADTATAINLEAALDKLVKSINAANLGITLTNNFTDKTASDAVPTVQMFTTGLSFYISTGNSGNTTAVDTANVKAIVDLYDLPTSDIDVLVIPEYNSYEIVNYAADLALKNNYIVLTSLSNDSVSSALTAAENYSKDNRGSLAIYFPDVYYNDFYNNEGNLQRIPACMAVLNTYAKTDVSTKWGAPAGVTRGTLSLVNSLAVELTDDDRSTLYDNNVPINCINNISGRGFVVWGNKTTDSDSNFFDRINISKLTKYVTKEAYTISWDYLFEPITPFVFNDWTMRIEAMLNAIKTGYGLVDFQVIMDDTINTEETIAKNQLNGIIRLKPQEVAEYIDIDLTITDVIEVSVAE